MAVACAGMIVTPVIPQASLTATPLNPVTIITHSISLSPSLSTIDPALKHVMPSGLTIYSTPEVAEQIVSVAMKFPEIWTDRGTTVDISEEKWIPIPLKKDT